MNPFPGRIVKILSNCIIIFCFSATTLQAQLYRLQQIPANQRVRFLWTVSKEMSKGDSALLKPFFDSVKHWAKDQGYTKLYSYTEVCQCIFTPIENNSYASRAKFLLTKEPYFDQYPDIEIRGCFQFFLGNYFYKAKDFERSFHHSFIAQNIFKDIGYDNLPLAGSYTSDFFKYYYYFGDYTTAIEFLHLSLSQKADSFVNRNFLLNDLGLSYIKINDYPKALSTFTQTIEYAKKTRDTTYIGIASGNYGNVLRLQEKYKEALPYLYTDVAINEKKEPSNAAITCLYIANCLLHLDSITKAKYYIEYSQQLHPDLVWSNYGVNYYENKSYYYQKTGDYHNASHYQDSLLNLKDSLRTVFDSKILLGTALKTKEEKFLADKKKAEQEANKVKLIRNFTIVILMIAFAITLIFLNQKRKKERQMEQERERQANEKLKAALRQLDAYIINIKEKNALIEKIEAELLQQHAATPIDDAKKLVSEEQIERLHQSVIMTEDDWTSFKDLFEQVWPGFLAQINKKYDGLSLAEERVLALSRLNLESKDMAKMLGISIDSLRKSRYRLRKKFPLLMEDKDFKDVI